MDENNYETAIIVSDPLHMKRAMLLAEDAGIKAYSSPTPSTRYVSLRTKIPFLARETFLLYRISVVSIIFLRKRIADISQRVLLLYRN